MNLSLMFIQYNYQDLFQVGMQEISSAWNALYFMLAQVRNKSTTNPLSVYKYWIAS